MPDDQMPLIVPESAIAAHGELVSALGTESNPAQWMEFMSTVTRLLPDVLSVGRPTADAIKRSLIGELGFKSWKAMIEAPTASGGLGWSWSAWRAWRRAWFAVEAYPWLRTQPLSSHEVSTLVANVKRAGVPFPQSPEAAAAFQEQQRSQAERKRSDSTKALQERATTAEAALNDLVQQLSAEAARIATLREQLEQARTRADELTAQVGRQTEQIEQLKRQLSAATQTKPQPAKLTRWGHFMALFTGR